MCVYVCVFANPGPVDDYFKGIESPTTLFPRFRPPEVGWGGSRAVEHRNCRSRPMEGRSQETKSEFPDTAVNL